MQLEATLLFCELLWGRETTACILRRVFLTPEMNTIKPYIGDITFDCTQPRALSAFWAAVLCREVQEASDEWAAVVDPNAGPRLCFQRLDTPKTGKNRVHLDISVHDMEAEVARIVALGARKVRVGHQDGVTWTVLLDPEGNEFCVQPAL